MKKIIIEDKNGNELFNIIADNRFEIFALNNCEIADCEDENTIRLQQID